MDLIAADLHVEGSAGVVRAGGEDHPGRAVSGQDPDQAGDAVRCRFEVVGHGDIGPAGLHDHGVVHVALREDRRGFHGLDAEVTCRLATEDVCEQGPGIGQRVTHPADLRVRGEQRRGGAVPNHRVPLQTNGVLTKEPRPPQFEQQSQHPREGFGVRNGVCRRRISRPDVQAKVRSAQRGERPFVALGVPGVESGCNAQTGSELFKCLALGRFFHREVQDGAVDDEVEAVLDGNVLRLVRYAFHHILRGGAGADRHAYGFADYADALLEANGLTQRRSHLMQQVFGGKGLPVGESHVEFDSMGPHQMHLRRQPGNGGQVPQ